VIGQTLDRYRIESKVGEGGMGVVYKARDTHLNRAVAIKVLPADKVADPDRKQRFVQEAKAASALNHPNIVTVHDIRSDGGIDFIVMEFAEGRTLEQVIPAKGLGVGQALRYAVQIADALARAHEAGIVHRDLKPSNVIVTAEDRVKVLDFGLAKLVDPSERTAEAATRTSPATDVGIVVGTAAYMSPEQAEGRKVDARSDIFSFGALLYEMVTGRRPFGGDSSLSVLVKILNEEPAPPSTIAASVPPEVERTILRCLRKDPTRRYQTMADLKVALDDLVADSNSGALAKAPALRRARLWRWTWAAGLIPIVLIAAYLVSQSLRSREPPAPPMRAVPLAALPGIVRSPSFSPDGDRVAFHWTAPNQNTSEVYVQQIGAGAPLQLTTDPANDYNPAWSPDGRWIAFLRQTASARSHELRLTPPLGGAGRKVIDIQPRGFLRQVIFGWCPDSSCLVVTDASSSDTTKPDVLFVVSIVTGEKRQLTTPPDNILADTDPAISPDGRWLVFRRDLAPYSGGLQLVALDAGLKQVGEPRALTPILLTAYGPKWISNNEIIFAAKGSLYRMRTAPGSTPERLPFVGDDGIMPALSHSEPGKPSRLAYVRSFADTNIWRIDTSGPGALATSPPVVAIASSRRDALPALSDDGQRVAFISDRTGESEVWAADPSGANAIPLTSLGANPGYPRWSPDRSLVTFQTNAEDHPTGDVYVVPAEGGQPRNVTQHPANDAIASFSRDGKWIYFQSVRGGLQLIWKIPVSGGTAVQVSTKLGLLAIESTDGAYVYHVEGGTAGSPGPLWRLPVNGGEPVKLLDGVVSNSFDVIDSGIYYMEQVPGETSLRYFDFATRESRLVARNLGAVAAGLASSRDGRTIFYSRVDSSINDLMLVENFR
jgi:Tol biopolymer transport system component/tRNA A-37 threonylcarbamoyl transferase component Bud32